MNPPFDAAKLDRLMEDAAIDVVLATSAHNVRYLLGGYRFFFFEHMSAIGLSRYLPCVAYPRGRPEDALYVGNPMERQQLELNPVWLRSMRTSSWTTSETARTAADALRRLGLERATIGIERSFIPDDAHEILASELAGATFVEALPVLAELRAIKRPDELEILGCAADEIVAAMLSVIQAAEEDITTAELAQRLRIEQTNRGLCPCFHLIAAGPELSRAPSEQRWSRGQGVSLDSGASLRGYIGDVARMGCMGEPTPRMSEILGQVHSVQQAARAEIAPGRTGGAIFEAAFARQKECPDGPKMSFLAHGMGLVSHEVPFLTHDGAVPYAAVHHNRPLEPGMVLSVETELIDDCVGFVKLEDMVVVTDTGSAAFGDRGRGWNVAQMS